MGCGNPLSRHGFCTDGSAIRYTCDQQLSFCPRHGFRVIFGSDPIRAGKELAPVSCSAGRRQPVTNRIQDAGIVALPLNVMAGRRARYLAPHVPRQITGSVPGDDAETAVMTRRVQ